MALKDEWQIDIDLSCIERYITDLNAELTDNDIAYNDQLKIAELMIIDSFYNDRSAEKIPGAAIFILNQFRIAQA